MIFRLEDLSEGEDSSDIDFNAADECDLEIQKIEGNLGKPQKSPFLQLPLVIRFLWDIYFISSPITIFIF